MVAGCSGTSRSLPEIPMGAWPQRAHDSRNTGSASVTVPSRGTAAWDAGEAHIATPLVADGTVYSVSHEATALDAKNGNQQWSFDFDGKADHTPVLLEDALVAVADDQVVALGRDDGSAVWSTPLPEIATGAVTATPDGSLVVVPVGDNHLEAFDPENGERQWRASIIASRKAAISGETVYATGYRADGDTGLLRAFSAADGSTLWEADLTHPDAPPVVVDEGLVVADAGTVALHDTSDGTRRRALGSFGERVAVPPAVSDGTVYVAAGNGGLAAVSLDDGTETWRNEVRVNIETGISVGIEAVVAPVSDLPEADLPGIAAFERTDGSPRWEHAIEGFDAAASTPAVLADAAVFYTSNESIGVVALGDLPSGTK